MAVVDEVRGPLWVDGRFTVRVRGLGAEPSRIVRVRRPFALIGQVPGADIRLDDPAVDGRHALLLLDARGVFGVDLRSATGTRFAGADAPSAWLGAGDILEVAGRRIELLELRIDGEPAEPPLSDDDPFDDDPALVSLTLEPLDAEGPPWMLGSALAFVGRGEACAIRLENASASMTHCALLRTPSAAYVIDLLGRRTQLNGVDVGGAAPLLDGDVLAVGKAHFAVKVEAPGFQAGTSLQTITPADPRGALVALMAESVGPGLDSARSEILDVLRQFRADTATLLEAQLERIEGMNREITSLREEVRGRIGAPPEPGEPLRLDLIAQGPPLPQSTGWLLDRLDALETESRSSWKDLLGKVAATVSPRQPARPGQSLASTGLQGPLAPRS